MNSFKSNEKYFELFEWVGWARAVQWVGWARTCRSRRQFASVWFLGILWCFFHFGFCLLALTWAMNKTSEYIFRQRCGRGKFHEICANILQNPSIIQRQKDMKKMRYELKYCSRIAEWTVCSIWHMTKGIVDWYSWMGSIHWDRGISSCLKQTDRMAVSTCHDG